MKSNVSSGLGLSDAGPLPLTCGVRMARAGQASEKPKPERTVRLAQVDGRCRAGCRPWFSNLVEVCFLGLHRSGPAPKEPFEADVFKGRCLSRAVARPD